LHREEAPDALSGLARVTRFHQDDAHIFVAPEMVEEEIKKCFEFMKAVYGTFNLDFKLTLSTRPKVRRR
jgi:threonyl-tRNA synthetase